jgi:gliding-associated putative ABC transporter substrate-binding component GldG
VQLIILLGIIVAINVVSTTYFARADLTSDQRFTLSDSTKSMLHHLKDQVFVKVYLYGDMPAGFKQLSTSVREMLDEFKAYGGENIQYEFIDPTEGKNETQLNDVIKELGNEGLQPVNVQLKAGDSYSEKIIFPGAIVYYRGKQTAVSLLENTPGTDPQIALNTSTAHLEYNLTQAIDRLSFAQRPKIGFVRGQGEFDDAHLNDFMNALNNFYTVNWIDISNQIKIDSNYKAIVVARPTQEFDEKDKFKIDQYIMHGGKVLWLVEALNATLDSLATRRSYLTVDYPLNLEDQLFKYGVRINPDLVMDLQCNPLPLVVGTDAQQQQPRIKLFPCMYFPIFTPTPNHPINKNIDAVEAQFASSIDTVEAKGVKKTILLTSSDHTKLAFSPWLIDLAELRTRPDENEYNKKDLITGVLLEGSFQSVFKNRIAPEMTALLNDSLRMPFKEESVPTKMIVLSDGDIAANEVNMRGQTGPLGYYRFTDTYFSNKNFLLNCIDYLTGNMQNLETRAKTVRLSLLDVNQIKNEEQKWQLINLLVPIAALILFGLVFTIVRRKIFA